MFFANLKEFDVLSIDQKALFNLFIGSKSQNSSIFERAFPKEIRSFKKDLDNLQQNSFRWMDIEIEEIKMKYTFVKEFNQKISNLNLNLLNTIPFEQLFPLKFIDMITEHPEYSFGQPIYNESLNFFTELINYFLHFYLLKDLALMDRIDAEYIESYSPISRDFIVKKNQNNTKFMEKYFNSSFNLHKFAIKLVDKFVVGCTWRWIGGNHKAHIYSVEICKVLMEYGLLDEDQMDELKTVLYTKIQTYRTLEDIIDRDSKTISEYWVNVWIDGLKRVREYYCEILILIIYRRQDQELLDMLQKFYKISKDDDSNVAKKKLENIIKFNKSVLFEEEFGRKLLNFLLGYILSQNKVSNKLLTTKKIEMISDNFLHIFSNIDDPYLHSIKLIREQEIQNYVKQENLLQNNPLCTIISNIVSNLMNIIRDISVGTYLYRNDLINNELEKVFDDLNKALDFENEVKTYNFGKKVKFLHQRILLNSNIEVVLLNLIGILNKHGLNNQQLMNKFNLFSQYFLLNNTENHCVFISFDYLDLIFDTVYLNFPYETIEMLFEVFSKYSSVMLMKEFLLQKFLDFYLKDHEQFFNPDGFNVLSKYIDLLALFINIKGTKIYTYVPEYDIRIAEALITKEIYFNCQELKELLNNPQQNDSKLSLFMNTLSLLQTSTAYRFTDKAYNSINKAYPLEGLKELITLCGNNLLFRSILLDLYSNVHIDFKNQLLDNRVNYYHTKPKDMQYEEDPFVDKQYDITLNLFRDEIEFLLDLWQNQPPDFNEEAFLKYANFSLFAAIIKLMNYFLVIKEVDLDKLKHYIDPLEQFLPYILSKKKDFNKIYAQKEEEIASPMARELEMQLSRSYEKKRIDKLRIIGSCKVILESCQQIIGFLPVAGETRRQVRKLLSSKTLIEKTAKAYAKSQNFSNKLQSRRENLVQITAKEKDKAFSVISLVSLFYEKYKMTKMSIDGEKNVYIVSLSDKSKEMSVLTYNLCSFIFNQIGGNWNMCNKNSKYNMIACLCNTLFISTSSIQENLYQVIMDTKNDNFLDNVWKEMKNAFLYLKFKTNIDKFWNETFTKTIMLLQFHQFLCEDNNVKFKKFFGEKILPNDTIDRVQRWTTIFQKLCENCDWHHNYQPGEICEFDRAHRPYLLPLATKTFDNLAELCTGPCVPNQKKIYTFIYDKYNGVLSRFWKDPDTEFYKMKLALIEFMITMTEGLDPDVVNYQTTNFDLKKINMIMVNSLKQLFYCKGLKEPLTAKNLSEYQLRMKDYAKLIHYFETDKKFSNHTLLAICIKLYSYIKILTIVKSKYGLFCKEREDLLLCYERKKPVSYKTVSEEELVTYRFLHKICVKVEVLYAGKLVNYYFQTLSKSFYLSDGTKKNFLANVDRSSNERKASEIMANVKYFEIEMDHNEEKYRNFYFFYRFFSSRTVVILEYVCLLLSFIINAILMVEYHRNNDFKDKYGYSVLSLGIIEICLSTISIISWTFLNYNLMKKINHHKFVEKYAWKDELNIWDNLFINVWQSFLSQKSVFIFLFHIIMVALGLGLSYGFFGIDLCAIISLSPTMQYIIRSVTEHGRQLISTLVLAAIIMFAYGIFVNIYFIDYLASDYSENCSSLAECYFLILDRAFRNGEGVGGLINIPYFGSGGGDVIYYFTLILNLSFFLLINTVFLNVILAVLVDTFSELRGKSDEYSNFVLIIF